jgi:hypothetical protein
VIEGADRNVVEAVAVEIADPADGVARALAEFGPVQAKAVRTVQVVNVYRGLEARRRW